MTDADVARFQREVILRWVAVKRKEDSPLGAALALQRLWRQGEGYCVGYGGVEDGTMLAAVRTALGRTEERSTT